MTLSPRRRTDLCLCSLILCLCIASFLDAKGKTTQLEIRSASVQPPAQSLESQVLDYRYAPYRWQTCIGLPDDPHKSIVGSDGGLYYDYGGGRFYDFQTRLLAKIDTNGSSGQVSQHLHDARTPIVITEQNWGHLTLQQCTWAQAPECNRVDEWCKRRVDYLWLKMINRSHRPATGQIVVQVDPKSRIVASAPQTSLINPRDSHTRFASLSPACATVEYADPPDSTLLIDRQPGAHRNWAKPVVPCDRRFRDVLVGWSRPLVFTYPAKPNETYHVAFGLIEGYHDKPGIRPLDIRIEGQTVQTVDLVGEFGKNQPAILSFEACDRNSDDLIEMGIYATDEAEDKNTILSGLWVFNAQNPFDSKQLLEGQSDAQALAIADLNTLAHRSHRLKLRFAEQTLAPGEESQALLTLYQGSDISTQTDLSQAPLEYDRAVRYWAQCNLPYDRIQVPDRNVQDLLDACIRNIYQAREIKDGQPAFQVGPTCYRGTWAADGPFILEAVTYLGQGLEARAGLEQQVDQDQGPGGVTFSKKAGLRLWMIWRHAQLMGDWTWLRSMWPRVEQQVDQIISYRRMTMDDPNQANYGLMPIGFGDGGLGGKHREYTNVYWTIAGLRAAIEIADRLDRPESQAWMAEYLDYWDHFEQARLRDKQTDRFGHIYIPVTMTGEAPQAPQRGAWAFLQSVYPGRIFADDDMLMLGTMAMLTACEKEGLIHGTGWLPDGIWNYAGSFYAHAHLWLGHGDKAASTLYAFGNHACPLLSWREEQNLVGQPENYCGDMPHNWASTELIRLVRHLMILERDDELHLFEGLPSSWTETGMVTNLKEIPTSFGPMSLRLEMASNDQMAKLTCVPPQREPIERLVIHTERFNRPIARVKLDGDLLTNSTGKIPTDRPFTLTLEFAK